MTGTLSAYWARAHIELLNDRGHPPIGRCRVVENWHHGDVIEVRDEIGQVWFLKTTEVFVHEECA